jgi:transposase-like protein
VATLHATPGNSPDKASLQPGYRTDEERYDVKLTISRAAREFGVARTTIYRQAKSGKLTLGRDRHGERYVDAAEMARVFADRGSSAPAAVTGKEDVAGRSGSALATVYAAQLDQKVRFLEQQVLLLERELAEARNREGWLRSLIETRLLSPPEAPHGSRERPAKKSSKAAKKGRKGKKSHKR